MRRRRTKSEIGWRVQDDMTARQRSQRWLARYGITLAFIVATLAVTATDFITRASEFWRDHQLLTSVVTEVLLILVVVFGADAVLRARARRRWRPLGAWAVHELDPITEIGEAIAARVHDYAYEQHGTAEPEGRKYYDDLLLEALTQEAVWSGGPDHEPLLEEVKAMGDETEQKVALWAPVLIAEPELGKLAALLPRILYSKRRLIGYLEVAEEMVRSGDGGAWRMSHDNFSGPSRLASELEQFEQLTSEAMKVMLAYRDDRPIVSIYSDD